MVQQVGLGRVGERGPARELSALPLYPRSEPLARLSFHHSHLDHCAASKKPVKPFS